MKLYDDFFSTYHHLQDEVAEAVTLTNANTSGLAELMEEADKHGYTYTLNCYEKPVEFDSMCFKTHVREMIFTPKKEV